MKFLHYTNKYYPTNKSMIGHFGCVGLEEVPIQDNVAFVEYEAYLDLLRVFEFLPLEKIRDAFRVLGEETKGNLVQQVLVEIQDRQEDLKSIKPRDGEWQAGRG